MFPHLYQVILSELAPFRFKLVYKHRFFGRGLGNRPIINDIHLTNTPMLRNVTKCPFLARKSFYPYFYT